MYSCAHLWYASHHSLRVFIIFHPFQSIRNIQYRAHICFSSPPKHTSLMTYYFFWATKISISASSLSAGMKCNMVWGSDNGLWQWHINGEYYELWEMSNWWDEQNKIAWLTPGVGHTTHINQITSKLSVCNGCLSWCIHSVFIYFIIRSI